MSTLPRSVLLNPPPRLLRALMQKSAETAAIESVMERFAVDRESAVRALRHVGQRPGFYGGVTAACEHLLRHGWPDGVDRPGP